jgi:hypothetical protein
MSNYPFEVSTNGLKEGVYFYKIIIDGEEIREKLVVW